MDRDRGVEFGKPRARFPFAAGDENRALHERIPQALERPSNRLLAHLRIGHDDEKPRSLYQAARCSPGKAQRNRLARRQRDRIGHARLIGDLDKPLPPTHTIGKWLCTNFLSYGVGENLGRKSALKRYICKENICDANIGAEARRALKLLGRHTSSIVQTGIEETNLDAHAELYRKDQGPSRRYEKHRPF
jgi:hypothetical protein